MKKITKTKKQENLNQGITLIALVITIIVLLILAAVSIATLTGENGILTKASTAKKETEIATDDEKVRLAVASAIDNNGNFDPSLFMTELTNQGLRGSDDGNGNVVVNTNNKKYTINDKGKITEENKTSTEEEEIVTAPKTYVKSFNAGENGDNIIGYIVNNEENSNAYDMIFVGTGRMIENTFNGSKLDTELNDYLTLNSYTEWKKDFINLKFSSGITDICDGFFNNSKTLKKILLPNTLEDVGGFTFVNDTNVKNITIPASIKKLNLSTFSGWTSEQTITILGSPEVLNASSCQANIVYKNQ